MSIEQKIVCDSCGKKAKWKNSYGDAPGGWIAVRLDGVGSESKDYCGISCGIKGLEAEGELRP